MAVQGETIELDGSAMEVLCRYPWPGNIRELRNVLQRALLLAENNIITARELQFFPARFKRYASTLAFRCRPHLA